jgi:ketosteroid isomerase-like protein
VAELSRLEAVWNKAYLTRDADTLSRLFSYDLIALMTDMAVLNKERSILLLTAGPVKFLRYETSDLRIRVYGDAAVVTGRLQRTRNVNDQKMDDDWRFTKMYVRTSGRLQLVAWHASTNKL